MKIAPTTSPAIPRDHLKPSAARPSAATATAETAPATDSTAAAGRSVPPGLERVLGRLQSMAPDSMNRGQANALQHIEANIARYRDKHGIAADPASEPAPADATTSPAETPAVDATPPTTDTSGNAATDPAAATAPGVDAPPAAAPADTSIDMSTVVAAAAPAPAAADTALLDAIPPAGSLIDTQA